MAEGFLGIPGFLPGFATDKTEQELERATRLPEQSPFEAQMDRLFMEQMMPSYMSQAGYEMERVEISGAERAELDELSRAPSLTREQRGRLKELRGKAAGFKVRKLASKKVERLRRLHGKDSPEYQQALEEYEREEVATEERQRQLMRTFQEKAQKFLNGDFSITEEQGELIRKTLEPQRAVITKMFDEMEDLTIGEFGAKTEQALDAVRNAPNPGAAFEALGDNVKRGMSMNEALEMTIAVNREMLDMRIEDATGEITKGINERAAAMGRSPTDPEFQRQIQQSVAREVGRGQLELSRQEAAGRMGIAQQRLAIAQQRGLAEGGLAEREAGLKLQVGGMLAPQQLQAGMNVAQFNQALAQQRMANLQAGAQMPFAMGGRLAQLRMAQPTQFGTTGQEYTPSALRQWLGISQVGADIFGAASGKPKIPGGGGGSGNVLNTGV